MGEEGRKAIMVELAIKINCGTDKCMACGYLSFKRKMKYCTLFSEYSGYSATGAYRLEACKKAEIKELR
jgi:hypothetical protein